MTANSSKTPEEIFTGLALIDTRKLRNLADWMDNEQDDGRWCGTSGSREVQNDLRAWAQSIDDAINFFVSPMDDDEGEPA